MVVRKKSVFKNRPIKKTDRPKHGHETTSGAHFFPQNHMHYANRCNTDKERVYEQEEPEKLTDGKLFFIGDDEYQSGAKV